MAEHPSPDAIQQWVYDATDRLFHDNDNLDLLLLHRVYAPPTSPSERDHALDPAPYPFRRSALRIAAHGTGPLHRLGRNPAGRRQLHDVLTRYIRHFDRQHTLLDLAVRQHRNLLTSADIHAATQPRHLVTFRHLAANEPARGSTDIRWGLSTDLAEILAPESDSKRFVASLVAESMGQAPLHSDRQWTRRFELCLALAFAEWYKSTDGRRASKDDEDAQSAKDEAFRQLVALQSAFAFFRALASTDPMTANVTVRPLGDNEFLVAIVLPDKPLQLTTLSRDLQAAGPGGNPPTAARAFKGSASVVSTFVNNTVADMVPPSLAPQASNLTPVVEMLGSLTGEVHEGTPLEFFFVYGERSAFEDSSTIAFRTFDRPPAEFVALRTPEDRKKAASSLIKEHFPWFENGRYALFWDVSTADCAPAGVVSRKGTSWRQLVLDSLETNPRVHLPDCCVGFLTPPDRVEWLSVTAERVERRLRHTDEWIDLGKDRPRKLVDQFLQRVANISDDERRRTLRDIVLRVAMAPEKGGIVVLPRQGCAEPLKQFRLGHPWSFPGNPFGVDLLIAHDGATLWDADGERRWPWTHRLLLVPDQHAPGVRPFLQVGGKSDDWPLKSKGTRRWNGALVAFREEVDALVVMSQDGDIHLWRVALRDEETVEVWEYEIEGSQPRYLAMENNKFKYEPLRDDVDEKKQCVVLPSRGDVETIAPRGIKAMVDRFTDLLMSECRKRMEP